MKPIPVPDYHLHTTLCKHAEGTARAYRSAALELGVPEICFTDHCPTPDGYDPAHRMGMEDFSDYRAMILDLQDGNDPEVLFGIEADYYEGCERFLEGWLPAQGFDFVLGSVHFIDGWGFDNPEDRHIWDSVDVQATWRSYFGLIGRLAASGLFDAVGHLDLPKKFGYRPSDRELAEMAAPALDRIAKAGMGIEVNASGLRKPIGEAYPSLLLLSLARDREIPICFGSDAHRPGEVGAGLEEALDLALQAGYTHAFRIRAGEKVLVPLPGCQGSD
jgi:histidinol-phosphatase (PHP family)